MLLVVLLLLNDDVPVNQDVIEEEELSRFGLFATEFSEDALSDQDSARNGQWLTRSTKAAFHHSDPLGVSLTVSQPVHHFSCGLKRKRKAELRNKQVTCLNSGSEMKTLDFSGNKYMLKTC